MLTVERAKELVEELERRLVAHGIRGSVRIVGGAAMVLRFPDDPVMRVTTDVDAAYEPRPEIDEVIAEIAGDVLAARRRRLPVCRELGRRGDSAMTRRVRGAA
ncbi:hypothetical protein GCM10017608_10400 [Agromyces luteolus]|uniref:Nucleotidyl transferase AbiEii/AbiGii toxin family protein n=1 Tax=Agromyces luteolus TaxID=88373 RepID=A0A7C9LEE5_9MICO|nr:hypothetical protein [Agromyces luteolus]MUN08572.1 hypothetical protein [Agromyces luteolus]GLK27107.1 hypothetical protein GCM10017608_10400 [Agromyces luteolus]